MTNKLTSYSPATGQEIGSVPISTPADVDAACRRAHAAFTSPWRTDTLRRAAFLNSWADNIEARAQDIAALLTLETGKVRRESDAEIRLTLEALRFNAPLSRIISGTTHELPDGSAGHVIRQPAGVSAFIVPWNWPIFLLFRDMAPALAAGVTAVVKPAPQTPLSLELVLSTMPELPEPVVQAVYGEAETGSALIDNPLVKIVCFTGSTEVGRSVATAAARRFARPILELGGKGMSVIFADADLDRAVTACVQNGYLTSGQMCMANSRLLVERSAYDQVVEDLTARVAALRVGDPEDPANDMGPVISKSHGARVQSYIDIASAAGQITTGGGTVPGIDLDGAYLNPTVIAGETIAHRIASEEIFGPVVSVEAFDTAEEAARRANDTRYGLSAAIWTEQGTRAWKLARELEFGTVWVNRYNRAFAEVPSGGMKESGTGRSRGFEGLHEFTELKHINWEI